MRNNTVISPAAIQAIQAGDLYNFIAAITPGGIEAQESAGQAAFVSSTTLPKEMLHGCTREKLEQMGIKFGADVDDLFVTVQLPDGWKKVATDHSMWSDLIDEKGRKRAAIFYKAAFYDCHAHITLCRRYGISSYGPCDSEGNLTEYTKSSHMLTTVKDGEDTIYVAGVCKNGDYEYADRHTKIATDWLDKHYPGWKDPMAYWE